MKRTKFLLTLMLAGVAFLSTSCLSNEESDPQATCYVTIDGNYPNYKLYADGGGIITPTAESVNSLTSSKGFGNFKRAAFGMTYKTANVTTDEITGQTYIKDAQLTEGQLFPVNEIKTKLEAETELISSEDSTFAITEFTQVWAYNGYLTTLVRGYYSTDASGNGLYPTTNLVYDPSSLTTDAITFKMYYNRHSAQSAAIGGASSFATSYSLEDLVNIIPGSEDVKVTIQPDRGADPVTITVSRKNFKFTR